MKKILFVFLILVSLFIIPVKAEEQMASNAKSAILIEASTGTILFEKSSNEKFAPASMTKMMSLLLIMENIDNGNLKMDEIVKASKHASSMGGSQIYLEENGNKSKEYNLADYIPNILSFNFKEQIIYLTKDETTPLEYTDVTFKQEDYNFKIKDPDIAKYEDGKIIALKEGKTYLYSDKIDQELEIVVTNLLTKPYATKEKKKLLTCHAYTEEESKLLDTILEYKVNKAGYQTRAGALAAARFLTLEFAYRVPYFYENGRVPISSTNKSNINNHIADGEGRYYKKGLYLSDSKKKQIIKSYKGPAIWGCNLMNFETREEWGYYSGQLRPNGLDCSGFVTWALKQAGFEPGDVGAGEDPGRDGQCTDLGKFVTLSDNINNIKAGDLLNWWGHIAMLIGIDNDTYYVAESLSYIGGVRAMIYTKQELLSTFKYAVLMDDYYKKEGLYTKMW